MILYNLLVFRHEKPKKFSKISQSFTKTQLSYETCELFKNNCFEEHLWSLFVMNYLKPGLMLNIVFLQRVSFGFLFRRWEDRINFAEKYFCKFPKKRDPNEKLIAR